MDVGTIAGLQTRVTTPNAPASQAQRGGRDTASVQQTAPSPYQVNVKEGAQPSGAAQNDAIKGLTKEQTKVLQAGIDASYQKMLDGMAKAVTNGNILVQGSLAAGGGEKVNSAYNLMIDILTGHNNKLQGYVDDGTGFLNFGGVKVEAAKFALPAVGTTAEEAAGAIAEGGDWSVDAVSDRIFGLAEAIAGGDSDRLKAMQDAVEEGFKQAGVTWKDAMGSDKMPQITQDTHDEINRRFEAAFKKLAGNTAAAAGAVGTADTAAAAAAVAAAKTADTDTTKKAEL